MLEKEPLTTSEGFVGYTDIINGYKELVTSIKLGRYTNKSYMEINGTFGTGKTTLLHKFAEIAREMSGIVSMINFNETNSKSYQNDLTALLQDSLKNITIPANGRIEFENAVITYRNSLPDEISGHVIETYQKMNDETKRYDQPPWLENLSKVVGEYINILGSNKQRPTVIMFDSLDNASVLINFIEELVFTRMLTKKNILAIVAVRNPNRWVKPEVRYNLINKDLTGLTIEDTKKAIEISKLETNQRNNLPEYIYSLTRGNPYATSIAIQEISKCTVTENNKLTQKIIERVFKKIIEERAFVGCDNTTKLACMYLSVMRAFDVPIIQKVLLAVDEHNFSKANFDTLFWDLRKSGLLAWENGFVIKPFLRHIIEEYYMATDPSIPQKIHHAAIDCYKAWLEKTKDHHAIFICELLYHLDKLGKYGETKNMNLMNTLVSQIENIMKNVDPEDICNTLNNLADRLNKESFVEKDKLVEFVSNIIDSNNTQEI
jgi:hypothetical protein